MSFLPNLDRRGRHYVNETFTRLVYTAVVRQGDTVLDAGANEGAHTEPLAGLVGPSGVVHAFEPNVAHFTRLLAISHVVRLWPLALGDRLSIETLNVPEGLDGWASLGDVAKLLPNHRIHQLTVIQSPLDALGVRIAGRLSFIKLDVEGRELAVLRGALQLIRRYRPVIVCENVDAAIVELMSSLQYVVTDFFGTLLGNSGCLSGAAKLPNSILIPGDRMSSPPFLVAESREVDEVLATAKSRFGESRD